MTHIIRVPAALFLIQLPADSPGKTAEDNPSTRAPEFMWETQMEARFLASVGLSPGHCSHMESEPG